MTAIPRRRPADRAGSGHVARSRATVGASPPWSPSSSSELRITRVFSCVALEWGKANGDIAEDITAYGKSLGQIGHRMFTDGKDLVVIDEWPDADTFSEVFSATFS